MFILSDERNSSTQQGIFHTRKTECAYKSPYIAIIQTDTLLAGPFSTLGHHQGVKDLLQNCFSFFTKGCLIWRNHLHASCCAFMLCIDIVKHHELVHKLLKELSPSTSWNNSHRTLYPYIHSQITYATHCWQHSKIRLFSWKHLEFTNKIKVKNCRIDFNDLGCKYVVQIVDLVALLSRI